METDVCVHALVSVPHPNRLHRDDSTCKQQQRQRHLPQGSLISNPINAIPVLLHVSLCH